MGLKFQLTKDADRAICLIYKEFLNRRKSGLQKSRAKDFSMPQSREPIYSSMPQVDFNDALSELNSVGLIRLYRGHGFLLDDKGVLYMENAFPSQPKSQQATTFNFSGAIINNSTIGNQNTVGSMTYNARTALEDLEVAIGRRSAEDQVLLNEMLDLLRDIQRTQQPIEKGRFTRFYELVKGASDLALPVGQFLFETFFAPR